MRTYFVLLLALPLLYACGSKTTQQAQTEVNDGIDQQTQTEVNQEIVQQQQSNDQHLNQGKEIIKVMLGNLSGELKRAMRRGGVREAVPYCNANALPITAKVAKEYGAQVKRTSIKNRNAQNAPNAHEKLIIEQYERSLAAGKKLKPSITPLPNGNTMFNAPILLRASCLNCHGTVGTNISENDYQVIKSLYPQDKATGYKVAELRGIWSIVFEKK